MSLQLMTACWILAVLPHFIVVAQPTISINLSPVFMQWNGMQWIRSWTPLNQVLRFLEQKSTSERVAEAPVPIFDPSFNQWTVPAIQSRNNCYNFATNQITNSFAQPGRATGTPFNNVNECGPIVSSSISDGLIQVQKKDVGNYEGPLKSCHYLSLVITAQNVSERSQDFHWFRLMKPGVDPVQTAQWWHKPGSFPVMRLDFSNKTIEDVETADRGPYKRVCGYFRTCVQIA